MRLSDAFAKYEAELLEHGFIERHGLSVPNGMTHIWERTFPAPTNLPGEEFYMGFGLVGDEKDCQFLLVFTVPGSSNPIVGPVVQIKLSESFSVDEAELWAHQWIERINRK